MQSLTRTGDQQEGVVDMKRDVLVKWSCDSAVITISDQIELVVWYTDGSM